MQRKGESKGKRREGKTDQHFIWDDNIRNAKHFYQKVELSYID